MEKEEEEDEGRYIFDLCHYKGEYHMTEKMGCDAVRVLFNLLPLKKS